MTALDDLSPRAGKVLRYLVGRTADGRYTQPADCVVKTIWSDLPHTEMQAKTTLRGLVNQKLATKSQDGYQATKAGSKLIVAANERGWWQTAPPPRVTNTYLQRRKEK